MPWHCRVSRETYQAQMSVVLKCQINGRTLSVEKPVGPIPIMVGSKACHVSPLSPADRVRLGFEEAREVGGYFIVNGNEKVVRLLAAQRAHMPFAVERGTLTKSGPMFTQYGCLMRSLRSDLTGSSLQLLYLTDGTMMVRVWADRKAYFLPLVTLMRACSPKATDAEIYQRIVGDVPEDDIYIRERLTLLLAQGRSANLISHESCVDYIGNEMRRQLSWLSNTLTGAQVGQYFIRKFILVHLSDGYDKVLMLCLMARKLFALVRGKIRGDNMDVLGSQELWTAGMLYGAVVKERLFQSLLMAGRVLTKQLLKDPNVETEKFETAFKSSFNAIGKGVTNFLATGNFSPRFCSDLQQTNGFVVMADKLNALRFTAHFRAVHRGAYFAEMKTTTVRKLLPDSWGFQCPVHTPDGAPCGLLNHLTASCKVVDGAWNVRANYSVRKLAAFLEGLGMHPVSRSPPRAAGLLTVTVDGVVVGMIPGDLVDSMALQLRAIKDGSDRANLVIPPHAEVVVIPYDYKFAFNGVYIFTGPSRMVRPVRSLQTGRDEWIGTMEQPYFDIAVRAEEATPQTQYVELSRTQMLSVVASLTPFSDFNQSPRNMYQCQMGKQTMGVPLTNVNYRSDNKLFRLTHAQVPVVRTDGHRAYEMDEFPNGCNAVVAVLAYTGYDMEDAMIINKSSYERGFAHACVFYSIPIDLKTEGIAADLYFAVDESAKRPPHIDKDGLPLPGCMIRMGDVLAVYYNRRSKSYHEILNKKIDPVVIDCVAIVGLNLKFGINNVTVTLREPRNPVIGDKFSSRHGQKGTLSRLYPQEDMPFSDNGIVPDVLINPHAFPSRMTIGMLLESMAGKSGALLGEDQNATPFEFDEQDRAVDYFGKQLLNAGYSYYGSETMYSGVLGTQLTVEIFQGVVFYQRLRHMVNDKFQVRSTGKVNELTHQPVGGRKRGGGIRVGEMERDSMLAHGAAFMINDRLMQCSDYSQGYCCSRCGSILSVQLSKENNAPTCRYCVANGVPSAPIVTVALPFVFRYLVCELGAFSIRCSIKTKPLNAE